MYNVMMVDETGFVSVYESNFTSKIDAEDVAWEMNDESPLADMGCSFFVESEEEMDEVPDEQGVAEGQESQVGDEVYYGHRLVGWFKGYSDNGKIITEPNVREMGDEYFNKDVYWEKQDNLTIKPKQGVAEGSDDDDYDDGMIREFTYCEADISDLHKDALGYRPTWRFWNAWHNMTPERKQQEWDLLVALLKDDNE